MADEQSDAGRSSKRLQDLIEISARLFRAKGYAATSMQDIAREAGMLKGSLYHHIGTKEDLLWLISKPTLSELVSGVREILEDSRLPLITRLRQGMRVHVRRFHSHDTFMAVVAQEGINALNAGRHAELVRLQKEYFELWQTLFRKGIRSGEIDASLNPAIMSYAVLGMVNWMLRWYDRDGALKPDEIADQFARLLIDGFQPSKPPKVRGVTPSSSG